MFTLAPSTFKLKKQLVKLLIPKQAKVALMVSFIPLASALEIDSLLKYLSVGMPVFKKEHRSVPVQLHHCLYCHCLTLSKNLLLLHPFVSFHG